jgi:hypothetical protein
MKSKMLPVIAALIIALLVIPMFPVAYAATPSTSGLASVVTIAEDDLKRETGIMVLGLAPTASVLTTATGWYTDSTCATGVGSVAVGPELTDEPVWHAGVVAYMGPYYKHILGQVLCDGPFYFAVPWPKPRMEGWDLLSQHKVLATLNGVPTTPDYLLCEIVEKEKAKIPPMDSKTASKRQFLDEIVKTTLQDVTSNFVCKFHWIKPGVGALDVYFVGPRVDNFIADHMVIVTVGYKVGRNTVWASELQDICILGWSMGNNGMFIWLFDNPGVSATLPYPEGYFSWDDALGPFVSCDEAAAWQLAWIHGGWPWSTN